MRPPFDQNVTEEERMLLYYLKKRGGWVAEFVILRQLGIKHQGVLNTLEGLNQAWVEKGLTRQGMSWKLLSLAETGALLRKFESDPRHHSERKPLRR